MNLKRFYILSAAVHLILLALVVFLPSPRDDQKKKDELFARLISPEELLKPDTKPLVLPRPLPPRQDKKAQERPAKTKGLPKAPRVPYLPSAPEPLTEEKPVVPGEGKETGRPLPEGVSPRPGPSEKAGRREGPGMTTPGKPSKPAPLGREKLYDPAVIGDLAKRDAEKYPQKNNAITFDTSEYRYKGYMKKLKEKIENIWVYPAEARAKGVYGDLKIQFTIRKDGRLGSVELVRTSGYRMLDEAALKALRDGDPFWPLPEEWGMDSYTIVGHFIYSLGGYYIR